MNDLIIFDISLLRTVVVVADSGSFSRAADALQRTQSSISLQIKRLEDQIEKRLFVRNGRGVRLTAEGEIVLTYARKMLRLNDEALAELVQVGRLETVRLGIPQEFENSHLSTILQKFHVQHPQVIIDVAVEPAVVLRQSLVDREFDMILVRQERSRGGGDPHWRDPLVWVASETCNFPVNDPIPLAITPEPCIVRSHALESLRRHSRSWRAVFVSGSVASIAAAVKAGVGISAFSKSIVEHYSLIPAVRHGLPPLEDTEIALLTAPAGLTPPASTLANMIVQTMDATQEGTIQLRNPTEIAQPRSASASALSEENN